MAKIAKWSNPTRQAYLIKLWTKYGNQCLLGHTACPILEHYIHTDSKLVLVPQAKSVPCLDGSGNPIKDSHGNPLYLTVYPLAKDYIQTKSIDRLYELKSETLIKDWIADDRAQAQAEYRAEYEARHRDYERRTPLHGKFSAIGKDIYYDSQPQFYLEAMGISGLTFKPFAKLRLASSYVRLYVDLSAVFQPLSKNQKRKAVRYGRKSLQLNNQIDRACWLAVKHYLYR
jgi:hypothetical protein